MLITPQAPGSLRLLGSFAQVLGVPTCPAYPAADRSHLSLHGRIKDLDWHQQRLSDIYWNPESLESNTDELSGRGLSSFEIACAGDRIQLRLGVPTPSGSLFFSRIRPSVILRLQLRP